MKVEEIDSGYFLVICYSKDDLEKISDISNRTKKIAEKLGVKIESITIDASPDKLSASKL